MFGYVNKKKLLKKMEDLKKGGRSLTGKYPPVSKEEEDHNIFVHGYESGSDNFYNGLLSWLRNQ